MTADIMHLFAAGADDAGSRRVAPPLPPLDGIAVRELADTTLDAGSTHACTCNKANEKRWTGRFRNGDFAQTGSLEA